MVRLAGVDLPPNKRVDVGLTYIYGVGEAVSKQLLAKAGLNPAKRVKDLNDNDLLALRDALKDFKVEGDLRREVSMSIKRLIDPGTYRGTRHGKGLPTRGQRTRTNARTLRGKRKTVGLGKKKEEEKKE